MTLSELAYSTAYEWKLENDHATISRLKLHIISARATSIQRRADTTKRVPQSLIVSVKCEDLISVGESECCAIGSKKTYRTRHKVPNPIIFKDENNFYFVGSSNQIGPLNELKPSELDQVQDRRFTSNQMYWCYMNKYIYILGANGLKHITIRYIPDNPLLVLEFGDCSCECLEEGELLIEESLVENIMGLLMARRGEIQRQLAEQVTINGDT
jgi:hypothetical protein